MAPPLAPSFRFPGRFKTAGLLLAALLAGCGGGISIGIGIGDGFDDGRAPSVSLLVSPTAARAGQPVQLAAAASSTSGIELVAFYRIDNGRATWLSDDTQAPYEFTTVTPTDGRGSVQYFARAIDFHGRRGDSAVQTVSLQGP